MWGDLWRTEIPGSIKLIKHLHMKRKLPFLFFLMSLTIKLQAEPQYILIKQTWWRGWKLVHVETPHKKLRKWTYDKKADTYYRMKTAFGYYIRLHSR